MPIDSTDVNYTPPFAGGKTRILSDRLADCIHVEDFGAVGDGLTDDTEAIQNADHFARTQNPPLELHFGNGRFLVMQLVIHTNSKWVGRGKNSTVIVQKIGANTDLIYGENSNANWGNPSPSNAPYNFELRALTLDGSWNNGQGNTIGSGIAIMGDHCIVSDVYVTNCAEHGIRTEFLADSAVSYGSSFLESSFSHIAIDYVGKHGWWFKGPHDSIRFDIRVLDASQYGDNLYDGFFNEGSSSRDITIHAATRSGRKRMRYAVSLQNKASHEFSGGCNIEGGYSANLGLFSTCCIFDPSTRFYAAWNGTNILMGGPNCALNSIRGFLQGPPSDRPICSGITFAAGAGNFVHQNDIDVFMVDQNAGAILFSSSDGGANRIRVKVYTTANVGIFGTPNPTNDILIRGTVNGGANFELNTLDQSTYFEVPAGKSYEWEYPYPFRVNPNVQVTIALPTNAATLPMWINGISRTHVLIFNPNSHPMPVMVRAGGVY